MCDAQRHFYSSCHFPCKKKSAKFAERQVKIAQFPHTNSVRTEQAVCRGVGFKSMATCCNLIEGRRPPGSSAELPPFAGMNRPANPLSSRKVNGGVCRRAPRRTFKSGRRPPMPQRRPAPPAGLAAGRKKSREGIPGSEFRPFGRRPRHLNQVLSIACSAKAYAPTATASLVPSFVTPTPMRFTGSNTTSRSVP